MKVVHNANLWNFHKAGNWVVVTTNTVVNRRGEAVMGAGIARQAANLFPTLPKAYGGFLQLTDRAIDTKVFPDIPNRIFCYPTKYDWRDKSSLDLIEENARSLKLLYYQLSIPDPKEVYLPQLGCNLGRLEWPDVEARISPILDDNFVVICNQ